MGVHFPDGFLSTRFKVINYTILYWILLVKCGLLHPSRGEKSMVWHRRAIQQYIQIYIFILYTSGTKRKTRTRSADHDLLMHILYFVCWLFNVTFDGLCNIVLQSILAKTLIRGLVQEWPTKTNICYLYLKGRENALWFIYINVYLYIINVTLKCTYFIIKMYLNLFVNNFIFITILTTLCFYLFQVGSYLPTN